MKHLLTIALSLALLVSQTMFAATGDVGVSIKSNAIKVHQLHSSNLQSVDVNLTAAQLDALNATPITVISAATAGSIVEVNSVICKLVSTGLTRNELGSGTIDFRYGSSGGGLAAQLTNAFVESATDAYFKAYGRDVLVESAAAVVAYASADVTAGTATLNCRVFYRTVPGSDI